MSAFSMQASNIPTYQPASLQKHSSGWTSVRNPSVMTVSISQTQWPECHNTSSSRICFNFTVMTLNINFVGFALPDAQLKKKRQNHTHPSGHRLHPLHMIGNRDGCVPGDELPQTQAAAEKLNETWLEFVRRKNVPVVFASIRHMSNKMNDWQFQEWFERIPAPFFPLVIQHYTCWEHNKPINKRFFMLTTEPTLRDGFKTNGQRGFSPELAQAEEQRNSASPPPG